MQQFIDFKNQRMTVIALLSCLAIYRIFISLLAYYLVIRTFRYHAKHPHFPVPAHYQAFMRTDFGKWNQRQIIKGCFLRLPWKAPIVLTFIIGFGFLSFLRQKVGLPEKLIDLWRSYMGLLSIKSVLQLKEQFSRDEKITTPITITNHVCWFDFTYMGTCFRKQSVVAKAEVKSIFILNAIADYLKCLYVDRSSANGRHRIVQEIKSRVQEFQRVEDDSINPIVIFPEGTVSNGRAVMSFKNGAFQNLTPITIFSLKYECKDFHMGMDEVNAFFYTVIVLCLNPKLVVRKRVVEPKKGEKVEEYRERCRTILAEMGGFTKIDSSYQDIVEYEKLKKQAKSGQS